MAPTAGGVASETGATAAVYAEDKIVDGDLLRGFFFFAEVSSRT